MFKLAIPHTLSLRQPLENQFPFLHETVLGLARGGGHTLSSNPTSWPLSYARLTPLPIPFPLPCKWISLFRGVSARHSPLFKFFLKERKRENTRKQVKLKFRLMTLLPCKAYTWDIPQPCFGPHPSHAILPTLALSLILPISCQQALNHTNRGWMRLLMNNGYIFILFFWSVIKKYK